MTAWISVSISAAIAIAALSRALWVGGRRDGKLDTILERLTTVTEDHENRIRSLEHPPRRR